MDADFFEKWMGIFRDLRDNALPQAMVGRDAGTLIAWFLGDLKAYRGERSKANMPK